MSLTIGQGRYPAGCDANNVYITLTVKGLNPNLRIVARATGEDAGAKLMCAGTDVVVQPQAIGGRHMAQSAIELMGKLGLGRRVSPP